MRHGWKLKLPYTEFTIWSFQQLFCFPFQVRIRIYWFENVCNAQLHKHLMVKSTEAQIT